VRRGCLGRGPGFDRTEVARAVGPPGRANGRSPRFRDGVWHTGCAGRRDGGIFHPRALRAYPCGPGRGGEPHADGRLWRGASDAHRDPGGRSDRCGISDAACYSDPNRNSRLQRHADSNRDQRLGGLCDSNPDPDGDRPRQRDEDSDGNDPRHFDPDPNRHLAGHGDENPDGDGPRHIDPHRHRAGQRDGNPDVHVASDLDANADGDDGPDDHRDEDLDGAAQPDAHIDSSLRADRYAPALAGRGG
jgi:hypothetical protein